MKIEPLIVLIHLPGNQIWNGDWTKLNLFIIFFQVDIKLSNQPVKFN